MSARKRLSSLLGAAIGLAGLAFVIRLVLRERSTLVELAAGGNPAWFAGALVAGLAGMTGIGLTWGVIVGQLGPCRLSLPETMRGYFVGQLGKYVPGGVWAVMGRGEWAIRAGVGRGTAYLSTLLSIVTAYLAASAVVAVTLLLGVRPGGYTFVVFGIAALAPAGFIVMHPRVFSTALATLDRLRRRSGGSISVPSWPSSIGFVARQIPSWLLISTATWSVATGLGVGIRPMTLVLATCTGWVAGFLFLPTPGGIGIREAVFVAVLGGDGIAAGVALAARVVFVLVDVLGAGASSIVIARRSRVGEWA